jgi:glucokinase
MSVIGAVDIGGTKIAVGLVSPEGQILAQEAQPTDRDRDYRHGLSQIQTMLHHCLERVPGARIVGAGVGCTGPVDRETGVLGPNSFLPLWEGINMIRLLEEMLGVPAAIENDADAAALGEYFWGAGKGARVCMYVTVSTGIGCGLIVDGHPYQGAGGAHPEIGHIIVQAGEGPVCFCGARGCWESLASGTGMARWYAEQLRGRGLQDIGVSAREICERAVKGELLAQEAVQREGYYLGTGVSNLVNAYTPDVIVLGGGVIGSWALFEDTVNALIRQNCLLVPHERVSLRLASLGAQTGLAGAARVWLHRYGATSLNDPQAADNPQ